LFWGSRKAAKAQKEYQEFGVDRDSPQIGREAHAKAQIKYAEIWVDSFGQREINAMSFSDWAFSSLRLSAFA
jgi:hypothetical protein